MSDLRADLIALYTGHRRDAADMASGFADAIITYVGGGIVTSHHALNDLTNYDDHTQYHNNTRALTWLGTRSTSDLAEGTRLYYTDVRVSANADVAANTSARHSRAHSAVSASDHSAAEAADYNKYLHANAATGALEWAAISPGVTDHGALTGLSDDDHTQYALLAGRAGGQTLIGGTAASNNLTVSSTSHGTKGSILFGTAVYDEVNNRLGLGVTPDMELHVFRSNGALSGTVAKVERSTTVNNAAATALEVKATRRDGITAGFGPAIELNAGGSSGDYELGKIAATYANSTSSCLYFYNRIASQSRLTAMIDNLGNFKPQYDAGQTLGTSVSPWGKTYTAQVNDCAWVLGASGGDTHIVSNPDYNGQVYIGFSASGGHHMLWDENTHRLAVNHNSPSHVLDVRGETSTTNAVYESVEFDLHLSSGSIADGFGPGQLFRITDASHNVTTLARVAALRAGANNSGTLQLSTWKAGSQTIALTINPTGVVNISNLTASKLVATDANKNLVSVEQTTIDHGSISGLSDDDHTQYHNDSRALTWLGTRSTTDLPEGTKLYYTEARVSANTDVAANTSARHARQHDVTSSSDHAASAVGDRGKFLKANDTTGAVEWATVPAGVTDHGALTGLGDDDHAQYHNDTRAGTWLATQSIKQLSDVDDTDVPAKNDVIIWNGSKFVFAPSGTSFTFSIASFSDAQSATILIGTGAWKAIGALTFTASYNNGPATGGYVTMSGWGNSWAESLTLTNTYQGPTVTTEAVNYPAAPGSATFVLHATDGTDPTVNTLTHNFFNLEFWGTSIKADTYTEADIEGLANSELANIRARTITVTAGLGEYIIYAYPSRLGTATFYVGFEGGFQPPETVSVTNSAGFTEDYYVYRSTNANLGTTIVTVL